MWEHLIDGAGLIRTKLKARSDADLIDAFSSLCSELGSLRPQNKEGELTTLLRDSGSTTSELPFHSDAGDAVALLCIRPATRGGSLDVVSSTEIHHALTNNPDAFDRLHQPWEFERKGRPGPEIFEYPIFFCPDTRVQCFLQMGSLRRRYGQGSSTLEQKTLGALESHLSEGHRRMELLLQRGEILLLNNRKMLHRRRSYENLDGNERMIARCWIDNPKTPYVEWNVGLPLQCKMS